MIYQEEGRYGGIHINKLLHGDCISLMQEIPDKSIDFICCDLPYGTTKNKFDIRLPLEALWGVQENNKR